MTREKLINDIVDDVLSGYALKRAGYRGGDLIAADFIDAEGAWLDAEDLANLIVGGDEARLNAQDRLEKRLAEEVRKWCEGPGADYVTERLEDIAEDARADAEEARADARAGR